MLISVKAIPTEIVELFILEYLLQKSFRYQLAIMKTIKKIFNTSKQVKSLKTPKFSELIPKTH